MKTNRAKNLIFFSVFVGLLLAFQNCAPGFKAVELDKLSLAQLGHQNNTDPADDPTTEPAEPTEPTVPTTPDEPGTPTEPSQPTEPTVPTEPTLPSEPTEPTVPTGPTVPTQPPPTTPTPSEPTPAHLFSSGFEEGDWMGAFGLSGSAGYASRVSTPSMSGSALQLKYLNNQIGPQGGGLDKRGQGRFSTLGFANREEAYLRYYVRFPSGFDWGVDGGKLPGLGSETPSSGCLSAEDRLKGWSTRYMWASGGGFKAYIYAMPQGEYDQSCGQGVTAQGFKFQTDRWYSLEQYVKPNTPGQANGVLKIWVDGQLLIQKTNIPYRNSGAESLKIASLFFSTFFGGSRGPTQGDQFMYMDSFVISREYIGR